MESYSDWLFHHGILGMKWGKRNGPPYPLSDGVKFTKHEDEYFRKKATRIELQGIKVGDSISALRSLKTDAFDAANKTQKKRKEELTKFANGNVSDEIKNELMQDGKIAFKNRYDDYNDYVFWDMAELCLKERLFKESKDSLLNGNALEDAIDKYYVELQKETDSLVGSIGNKTLKELNVSKRDSGKSQAIIKIYGDDGYESDVITFKPSDKYSWFMKQYLDAKSGSRTTGYLDGRVNEDVDFSSELDKAIAKLVDMWKSKKS